MNIISWKLLIVILTLGLWSPALMAEPLFEGYYQIMAGEKLAGYVVQRYDYDKKKKIFQSTSYLKTNALAGNIVETLKATSNELYIPLSYSYLLKKKGVKKTIDATFTPIASKNKKIKNPDLKMRALVVENEKQTVVNLKIPKGTFLSTFLSYIMLNNGLKKGKSFQYKAFAEETLQLVNGQAHILEETTLQKHLVFKIKNIFNNITYWNWVTPVGTTLKTDSPAQGIHTQLMANPIEALSHMSGQKKSLIALFGNIPKGIKHELKSSAKSDNTKKK